MPEPKIVVMGYMVKRVDEKNPDGRIVSRVFHAKSAAEDFAELVRRDARGDKVFVTEKIGMER